MDLKPHLTKRQIAIASVGALAFASFGVAAAVGTGGIAATDPTDLSQHGAATRLEGDQSKTVKQAVKKRKAKNVILIIGDGMGESEITVARNYAEGAAGSFAGIDALPLTGSYTTYSLTKDGKPDYVPDSASTGTAWATGTKTYDNAVSVDIKGQPQKTLLQLAKENGLKTGNVATSELQDATPAVQVANISQRKCYGPKATTANCPEAALENGGRGSITEQLLTTRPDVTLGGGAATFAETATAGDYAGETLLDQAEQRDYRIINSKAALDKVRIADQVRPLLGLFAEGNMPLRYSGPDARQGGSQAEAVTCQPNPERPDTQPTLADMTSKAITLLNDRKQRVYSERGNADRRYGMKTEAKGFFLQVEGASIDKQNHQANACGQIGETVDLDEAVQVALNFAKEDGNTLVLVAADHSHTSQIIEAGSASPGLTTTLMTADGSPMSVNYGTSAVAGSQQHTGAQVRIAGFGPQAGNIVGLTDQTDVFFTISRALSFTQE